jgi:hypothetical protein
MTGPTGPGLPRCNHLQRTHLTARQAIGIKVAFLLPYLWLFACGYRGGRGSSCITVGLAPVLLVQVFIGVRPALRSVSKMPPRMQPAVLLTSIVSILIGVLAAILAIQNESGC